MFLLFKCCTDINEGGILGATIEIQNQNVTIHFNDTDQLKSSTFSTDSAGIQEQLVEYYPYGEVYTNNKAGSFDQKRKYIGEMYDESTQMSYLNARYYQGSRGRFISQDPVFLAIGDDYKIRQKVRLSLQELLADPQQLNSYAYGRNNPIRYSDPDGNLSWDALKNDPIGSIRNSIGWNAFSLSGNLFNKPFSASLLRHSASLEPGDVNINSSNQNQYGNPINKIIQTDQYKNYINKTIERANAGEMTNSGHFEFENRSDLYYSLHGANIQSQVSKEDGEWVVNSTVTDRYDFNPVNTQTYKGTITRLPAAQAYKDQDKGVLSNSI